MPMAVKQTLPDGKDIECHKSLASTLMIGLVQKTYKIINLKKNPSESWGCKTS